MACSEDNRIFELAKINAIDLLVYGIRDELRILSYTQVAKQRLFDVFQIWKADSRDNSETRERLLEDRRVH